MITVGLSIIACLAEISTRLSDADAIAKSAVICASSSFEREALRVAIGLDCPLHEVRTLSGAVCLIGRTTQ